MVYEVISFVRECGWRRCPSFCCGPLGVWCGTVTRMSTACHSKPCGCCAATPLAVTLYWVGGVHIRVIHGLNRQVLRAVLVGIVLMLSIHEEAKA